MNAPPVRVVDVLSGLLDAERNNIIRFMGEGSPYLSRATAEIRRPLQEMVDANARHVRELGELIIALGGNPPPFSPVQSEEQYLAFLSLQFLLPKLVHTRELTITRYKSALAALDDAPPEVTELLRSHLAEHRDQLKVLEKTAADVIKAK
jgi:hypothetical protein